MSSMKNIVIFVVLFAFISSNLIFAEEKKEDENKNKEKNSYSKKVIGTWKTELLDIGMGEVVFIFNPKGIYKIYMNDSNYGFDEDFPFDEGKYWIKKDMIYMVSIDYLGKGSSKRKVVKYKITKIDDKNMEWLGSYYSSTQTKNDEVKDDKEDKDKDKNKDTEKEDEDDEDEVKDDKNNKKLIFTKIEIQGQSKW